MTFTPGQHYMVTIKGGRAVRRIYKWAETRFGSIPCHVFTSRVSRKIQAKWDGTTETLSLHGYPLPRQEVSIPEYDLAHVTLAD